VRQTFAEFANPRKMKSPGNDDDDEDDEDDDDDRDDFGGRGGGRESHDVDDEEDDEEEEEEEEELYEDVEPEEILQPSEGFRSFDDEKADIILKIHRLRRAGMPVRTFTMSGDIREMRSELARARAEMDLEASIRFQRKMLLGVTSAVEFLNRRYDPFDLQLDGWSESCHSDIGSYDRVFERLHEKYKNKVAVAPELELLLMLSGSAMMWHFTQTMMKSALPGLAANPEAMASMLAAMTQQQPVVAQPPSPAPPAPPSGSGAKPGDPPIPAGAAPPVQSAGGRREMRPPGMDLSAVLGGGGGMGGMGGALGGLLGGLGGGVPFAQLPKPQLAREPGGERSVRFAPGTKRPAEDPAPSAEGDDRLSDVVSEDLASVPDDLTSFGSDQGDTKRVEIGGGGSKKKGGSGSKKSKTVITL
jgi:hypothetical protein